jgi:hypothetical protein
VTVDDLLIRCDSLLSLIRYRESSGLSEQTVRDLDELLPKLRPVTDDIVRRERAEAAGR